MFTPEEYILKTIEWNGEGAVVMSFDSGDGMTGFQWAGAERKDFWHPDNEWEKILVPGVKLRLWTIQMSGVIGFQYQTPEGAWDDVWCALNDFKTQAERKEGEDAYFGEIERFGGVIKAALDSGMEPEEVMRLADGKGYTGNMVAEAMHAGGCTTDNKEAGEAMRRYWNNYWGASEDQEGWVNPAFINIKGADDGSAENKTDSPRENNYIFEGGSSEVED